MTEDLVRRIAAEDPQPPRRLNRPFRPNSKRSLLKAMAKEPELRYLTARELADDLHRFLEYRPIHGADRLPWRHGRQCERGDIGPSSPPPPGSWSFPPSVWSEHVFIWREKVKTTNALDKAIAKENEANPGVSGPSRTSQSGSMAQRTFSCSSSRKGCRRSKEKPCTRSGTARSGILSAIHRRG